MTTNYKLLKEKINFVYVLKNENLPKKDRFLDTALEIFNTIKDYERKHYHNINIKESPDYAKELNEAISDLVNIFGLDIKEVKKMTKNSIYLKHQSLWVNSTYILLEKGDL